MVATRAPLSGPLLLVTDLATMHFDRDATDRGYRVPAAWSPGIAQLGGNP